jgi:hypothetical protein
MKEEIAGVITLDDFADITKTLSVDDAPAV